MVQLPEFIGDGPCGAVFSDCRAFRYSLWRRWRADCAASELVAFVGLNPSTADETADDPTIRRCIGFAKDWGFGGLVMLNLFAFRATKPSDMKKAPQSIGGELNDVALRAVSRLTAQTVCCWGKDGNFQWRGHHVRVLLKSENPALFHLGLNGDGTPKHPLYLPKTTERIRW